jgi:hypothetical protein
MRGWLLFLVDLLAGLDAVFSSNCFAVDILKSFNMSVGHCKYKWYCLRLKNIAQEVERFPSDPGVRHAGCDHQTIPSTLLIVRLAGDTSRFIQSLHS